MSAQMTDAGNPHNAWQGAIRFGPLDLVLTEYAARVAAIDGIVINCLDQLGTSPRICREYRDLSQLEIPHRLTAQAELTKQLEVAVPVETVTTTERLVDALATIAPVVGTGYGLTHQDHEFSPGRFRQEARQPPLVAESAVG